MNCCIDEIQIHLDKYGIYVSDENRNERIAIFSQKAYDLARGLE